MKNMALYVSGTIFLIVAAVHFVRYFLGMSILLGQDHYIPVNVSLYAGGVFLVLALWMAIAALFKNPPKI